jgi:hypothetical protein
MAYHHGMARIGFLWLVLALGAAGTMVSAGCGSSAIPRASAPEMPSELAKCKVSASQQSPLVTEWPASEKANLEARLREGGVVVAYAGCSMRLLPQCRVKGSYNWQRTTPATDLMEIHNEDELYAKLPLGAASLEGELKGSGRLAVQTTVAGQLKLTGLSVNEVPTTGDCAGATHVVGALSVGAFKLKSGGDLSARGQVGAPIIGGQASTKSGETLLRQAGDVDRCADASDEKPNSACASPIQIFLWQLPSMANQQGPAGTVKVHLISADPDSAWEVRSGGELLCTTPCSKWLEPSTPLLLRVKDGGLLKRGEIYVPNLREHQAEAPLEVEAHTMSVGQLAGGATLTSLAGMAALTGIVLTSLGCTTADHADMCKAGLITTGVGGAALIPGIWIIAGAGAHAEISGKF